MLEELWWEDSTTVAVVTSLSIQSMAV